MSVLIVVSRILYGAWLVAGTVFMGRMDFIKVWKIYQSTKKTIKYHL